MNKKKARHPEDITHHMIRAAVLLFVVTAAAVTYWTLRDLKNDVSLPAIEPMTREAVPKNSSR